MLKVPDDKVPMRTRIAVGGALLGSFMAILNIQVVNTSLPEIQGGIGTGLDNGGWISTAYLVAEIIVIPLSSWLSEVFSIRRYFIGSTLAFLTFSVACGLAQNFPEMVILRALQGFAGGVMIPLALTCVITLLPERARPIGFAGNALTATFAPAMGPALGGAITDIYGWRYIFFLNLVPGVFMLSALLWGLKPAPMQLKKFSAGDWLGIFTIAVGLGSLEIVLEEGNKDDWFGSPLILRLSILSALSLAAFFWQELRPGNLRPLVNLRLFKRRNFALSSAANVLLGFVLYAAIYLIPVYLAVLHGYSATQAGQVIMWIGLPQLLIIPFTPYLMRKLDPRRMLAFGFFLFAISSFMNLHLGPDESGPQIILSNLIRALGQGFVFPPITLIVAAGIPPKDTGSASSLFNMLRNLGGAIGIAVIQTFVTNREKFHSAMLTPEVSLLQPGTRARLALLEHFFQARGVADAFAARHEAIIAIGRTIEQQSLYLAYGDAFGLLGVFMLIATGVTFFLGRVPRRAAPGAH